ncbi:Helix-turn-helix [Chlamydia trachomatis]|nr:Helix-turn-helix [Chlamydia trachomatis]CRH47187.1 Helix-turn-helix [Chlamydia trachomatis]CRH54584.1 Helix-turn-helix [Chlamydia trachomatis]
MVDNYADAIKELRNKMLLSQEEFAKVLGVSFASINR